MQPLRPQQATGNSTNLSRTAKIEWSSRARSRLLAADVQRTPTDGVRVEKVRHDDDGHALAGGIAPTALFPESPPPSEVALRATAATRPAFSGAPLVVLFVYISI